MDYTDRVVADWRTVRPDLDIAPTALVSRIVRLASYLETAFDDAVSKYALSHKGDYDTLAALRRTPDHALSPTQLAETAMITTGGMTSRLDRLENAGYVERHTDPTDRRALLVRLTESGREVVDQTLEVSLQWQQDLLAEIGEDDRAALERILRQLLIRLGDG